ncbi:MULTISPECIES: ABZJ_00895 family protein [unclassified Thioalkalivibrio]|uniref:ABZJ_00895 family protein n=1 Tax=unclassified Thioalkalivibrio TaxID=2621013 RepID=UPI0003600BA0|nr:MULTISPECIES: ABZJ_00895 family protein [unclassified Thioalkalivibrio]
MSIKNLLTRFVLLYFSLSIAAMVVIAYFELEELGTPLGIAILMLAVMWPCEAFGRRNGRYLSRSEKWRVIAVMVAVLLGTQLPVAFLLVWAEGNALDPVFLGILGVVALLYAGCVAGAVSITGRNLRKRGLIPQGASD